MNMWSKKPGMCLLLVANVLWVAGCDTQSKPVSSETLSASNDDKKLSATFECTRTALGIIAKVTDPEVGKYSSIGVGMLPACLALDTLGLVTNAARVTGKAWDWLIHGRAQSKLRDSVSVELREHLQESAPYFKEEKPEPRLVLMATLAVVAYDSKLTLKDIEKAWGKESDSAFAFKSLMYAAAEMRQIKDMSKDQIIRGVIELASGSISSKVGAPSPSSLSALERVKGHLTAPTYHLMELAKSVGKSE